MTTKPQDKLATGKHILFLDGDCIFCQRSAILLHRMDRRNRLFFTNLQGETARQIPEEWRRLTDAQGRSFGAAILAESFGTADAQYWRGADAPLRSLKIIGGVWKIFWLLTYVPRSIKDWFYQLVARNRLRLRGKKESCALPDEQFKTRMLP